MWKVRYGRCNPSPVKRSTSRDLIYWQDFREDIDRRTGIAVIQKGLLKISGYHPKNAPSHDYPSCGLLPSFQLLLSTPGLSSFLCPLRLWDCVCHTGILGREEKGGVGHKLILQGHSRCQIPRIIPTTPALFRGIIQLGE